MQDRLKYRIWDKSDECYINIDDCDMAFIEPNGKIIIGFYDGDYEDMYYAEEKNIVVEFYIGIKDKKGNLIYEKDIVENKSGKRFVIEWCQDKLGYVARNKNPNNVLESLDIYLECWKIIGNINESPELLET